MRWAKIYEGTFHSSKSLRRFREIHKRLSRRSRARTICTHKLLMMYTRALQITSLQEFLYLAIDNATYLWQCEPQRVTTKGVSLILIYGQLCMWGCVCVCGRGRNSRDVWLRKRRWVKRAVIHQPQDRAGDSDYSSGGRRGGGQFSWLIYLSLPQVIVQEWPFHTFHQQKSTPRTINLECLPVFASVRAHVGTSTVRFLPKISGGAK